MGKLRKKQEKKKISLKDIDDKKKRGSGCEQYPAFSFRYLTRNNQYQFDYFSNQNDKDKMMSLLLERVREISEKPYTYWNGLSKNQGSEMIPYSEMKVNPNGLILSQDDKLIVFRFNRQQYRIIGIRIESCPILYIIGFDFNYSAYSHGS